MIYTWKFPDLRYVELLKVKPLLSNYRSMSHSNTRNHHTAIITQLFSLYHTYSLITTNNFTQIKSSPTKELCNYVCSNRAIAHEGTTVYIYIYQELLVNQTDLVNRPKNTIGKIFNWRLWVLYGKNPCLKPKWHAFDLAIFP